MKPFIPRAALAITGMAMLLGACSPAATPIATTSEPAADQPSGVQPEGRLVVYSGRKEALIQPVLDQFAQAYPGIEIVLKTGDNSALANAILEEQANPQADVFITTEVMTVQNLFQQAAFEPYVSPNAQGLPAEYRQRDGGWTGLTLRARVIMFNTDLLSEDDVPTSVLDLTDPKWRGQIAAAGSTNGSMQAHIAALRELIGEQATQEWVNGLIANDVTFFGGHTDVRKAVGSGEFKLGLVNHYYYHLQKDEGSPVGVVYPDQGDGQMGTVVNATAIAIVKGAQHPQAARALVDFLLSPQGQELFAQLNYEYPIVPGVPLKESVRPINTVRTANVDLARAATDQAWVFDLVERGGMP